MNRREMLQGGLSVLAAVGIDGEVATLSPRNPQAIVLSTDGMLNRECRENLEKQWREKFESTALEHVPLIVLSQGMTIEVIDKVN